MVERQKRRKTNVARNEKFEKNEKSGVSLIALVITIIVVIILAAIMFGTSTRTITNANYSDYVNNVSEVYNAFHRRAVTIKGQEAAKGNNVTDAQVYNYLAKNGQTQNDFLVRAKLPAYTIITDEQQIGMKLPKMRVESGTGKMLDVQYAVTSTGDIFTWPPFDYEEQYKINADDTAEVKYVATLGAVTIKGVEIPIETGEKGELLPAGVAGSIGMARVSATSDSDGNITATVSGVDMENVQSIQYSLDNSSWQNDNTFEVSTSGDYTVYAKLRDNDGNEVTKRASTNVVIVVVENSIKNLVKTGALKIGDYIDYNTFLSGDKTYTSPSGETGYTADQTLTTDASAGWRVIYMDNSKIWIVPASAVTTTYLRGAVGYIKGPAELNKICRELYSSSSLGTSASNMTIDQLEIALSATSDGATKLEQAKASYVNNYSSNSGEGGTKAYTIGNYWIENSNGVSGGTEGDSIRGTSLKYRRASTGSPVTATQTYYSCAPNSINRAVGNVFSGYRWMASPCVDLSLNEADFGVPLVISHNVGPGSLAGSRGSMANWSYGVCPLVSLPSSLQLDANGTSTHTTQANTWKIIP